MLGELHEECAVAGVYLKGDAAAQREGGGATAATYALLAAQTNRGDLSCGIARYDPQGNYLIDVKRGAGTPTELFGQPGSYHLKDFLRTYAAPAAIGHNRYATSGANLDPKVLEYSAQPFHREHDKRCKEFAFCYNGNLTNLAELKSSLRGETDNYHFKTDTDTEVIKVFLNLYLHDFKNPLSDDEYVDMLAQLASRFDGAYNLCFLDANGRMIVARDPVGFRPLAWGENAEVFACASESSALRHIGLSDVRPVSPGEMLIVDERGVRSRRFAEVGQGSRGLSRCSFEIIYFMKSGSAFDDISVQWARQRIGRELGRKETLAMDENTVIAPVPRTGIPIRTGYVNALIERGQRFRLCDALIQEGYGRTFIADFGKEDRLSKIRNKFDMTPGYLEGQDVVLLDDSIVRGHTSRRLIRYVREYGGARSVHLRIGAPPNRFPCFYGINMPTRGELVAAGRSVDEVQRELGVDSVVYINEEELARALRGQDSPDADAAPEHGFCMGCFTGRYPTATGRRHLEALLAEEGDEGPRRTV